MTPGGGGGGRVGHLTKFYAGRVCPKVKTLTLLLTIFDRKGTPSMENCNPFTYLRRNFYGTFHLRNPLNT